VKFWHEALLWAVHKARAHKLQGGLAALGYRGASSIALHGGIAFAPRCNNCAFGKYESI